MVLPEEKERIVRAAGKEEHFINHGAYFVLTGAPCPFLRKGKCQIHKIKPLDCKAYPIFIRPRDGYDEWRVDKECPAYNGLSAEFVDFAKELFRSLTPKLKKIDWKIASCEARFKTRKLED